MRLLFKTVIFIVVLVIAALIALPFFINPNDYKQEITEQVENATGRTLTIDGDIGLSVFPWIALELGHLSLSNAEGFKSDTFAKVDAAQVRIKLLPLLSKKLELDTIVLDGLVLNLEKNKAGTTNWDDLAGAKEEESKTSTKDQSTDKDTADSASSDASPLAGLSIAGVKLTNANILWDDESKSEKYELKNFNLTTDPLSAVDPAAVNMSFDVTSQKPVAEAHIELETTLMVDMDKQQYSVADLKFTTKASGSDLPFEKANIELSGDISADMVKQLVTIKGLALSAETTKGKQSVTANFSTDISSNLANQQSSLTGVKLTSEINDPALPGGKANLELTTDISVDMEKQTASISKLVISLQDLLINGDISASKLLSDTPNVDGSIHVQAFNLRKLANSMAIELPAMADDSTLELVELKTLFSASSKSFNAKELNVTLDQSKLNGQFGINNFENPAFTFKLNLDEIDADRYLPPASAADESKTATAETSKPSSTKTANADSDKLPLEPLRGINAKGTIDIGKLKISGTHSQKIHLTLNANKGLIKLSPMSANLYKGQYKGDVNLDARGKTLKLSINEKLSGVQAGPLLMDLNGDDTLSGTANAQVKLKGNGATVDGIKNTLTGNGKFSFTDGAVKGINIAESIRKAKAALKGKTVESTAPLKTDFASLSGSFVATNGIISNQDLSALSPLLRIQGAGKVNLPKEGIDYGLKVAIVESSKGQMGKDLESLKGIIIPIKITGTFSEPKPTIDLQKLLTEQATAEAKAKVTEKLKEKLGGDLGGLLGGGGDSSSSKDSDALENKLKSFF